MTTKDILDRQAEIDRFSTKVINGCYVALILVASLCLSLASYELYIK